MEVAQRDENLRIIAVTFSKELNAIANFAKKAFDFIYDVLKTFAEWLLAKKQRNKEKYLQRMNKSLIAKKLNYSERSLYRLRDQAIQKFAIQLFGLTALEAV